MYAKKLKERNFKGANFNGNKVLTMNWEIEHGSNHMEACVACVFFFSLCHVFITLATMLHLTEIILNSINLIYLKGMFIYHSYQGFLSLQILSHLWEGYGGTNTGITWSYHINADTEYGHSLMT